MKRFSLLLAICGCVTLTGIVLSKCGWLDVTRGMSAFRRSERATVTTTDPFLTDAGLRWRRSQPQHWRMLMLQR
jgi:hypothetical protein